MFTGIVQDVGVIAEIIPAGGDLTVVVEASRLDVAGQPIGASIAVAGICLTVTSRQDRWFRADVSQATLAASTAGQWRAGRRVNLEAALRAGEPLGGHMVSGHIDGVGQVRERHAEARSDRLVFAMPAGLARYVARKGSVTVDGVSLTVNEAGVDCFAVNLVPHTLAVTTLGGLAVGAAVNLEVDVLARHVERLYEMMKS